MLLVALWPGYREQPRGFSIICVVLTAARRSLQPSPAFAFTYSLFSINHNFPLKPVDRVYFFWFSPAQSTLVSGPVRTHDCIFVLSKTYMCFGMGPPFQLEGSEYHWPLPLYWGVIRAVGHSLTHWLALSSTHTHTHTHKHLVHSNVLR
jgi:hypothetical protein